MNPSFKLGTVRGITIGVHWSWLVVFALLTYSLAVGVYPPMYPSWTTGAYWVVGAVASLFLFASVVAHELGHSFVALSKGMPVHSITLFIFGGVATITKEPERAGDEFQIAVAGPAVSLTVAIVSLALWFVLSAVSNYLGSIFIYLTAANLLLVAFNLIPGYPLDGGRVFRSIAWRVTGSAERATRIAGTVGVGVGLLLILGGVVLVLRVDIISGIWLAAIGWFLESAARQSTQQFQLEQILAGVQVGTLMDPQPVAVPPDLRLADLVETYVLGRNLRSLPVVSGDRLVGLVTLTDVQRVPRDRWEVRTAGNAMTPLDRLVTATPRSPLQPVLQAMAERDIHQVPVIEDGRLVGVLTRNQVIQYLQLRSELQRETTRPAPEQAQPPERPASPTGSGTQRRAEHAP